MIHRMRNGLGTFVGFVGTPPPHLKIGLAVNKSSIKHLNILFYYISYFLSAKTSGGVPTKPTKGRCLHPDGVRT